MSNRISPEHMAEIKAMTRGVLPSQLLEHIDALEAENERLRAVVKAARTVDKHLNSDAICEEMREVWGNTNTSIWRDVLLRLGSALSALEAEATDE